MKAELSAQAEVAVHLAHPPAQAAGISERGPHVLDIGVEPVFHVHDALAFC
jgi:hypothetical protein